MGRRNEQMFPKKKNRWLKGIKKCSTSLVMQLSSHSVMPDSLEPHGLCSMLAFPILHLVLELAQTSVRRVGDAV